ncbi:methyltransferase domain-containing protein [Aurantimonas sp. DM33-3]|nr:methyltransferase domain-containing protein [Aurantimonas sp. DM33-3]
MLDRLARSQPNLIADVGSGTGYISRLAAVQHSREDVRWILLENDPRMVQLATDLTESDDLIEPVQYDILSSNEEWAGKFDLAFSCFASLDFGMNADIARSLIGLVRTGGTFVIYLPDLLEDVVQMCVRERSMDAIHAYRRGETSIFKPDRFTDQPEPFVAHRLEHCISHMLAAGTVMSDMRFLERADDKRIVAMEFVRQE